MRQTRVNPVLLNFANIFLAESPNANEKEFIDWLIQRNDYGQGIPFKVKRRHKRAFIEAKRAQAAECNCKCTGCEEGTYHCKDKVRGCKM